MTSLKREDVIAWCDDHLKGKTQEEQEESLKSIAYTEMIAELRFFTWPPRLGYYTLDYLNTRCESIRDFIYRNDLLPRRAHWAVCTSAEAHYRILHIALAMEPLQLPAYVLLWILYKLPGFGSDIVCELTELHMVNLLQGVRNSARKIKANRRV